jgi:hypothetical protein
MTNTLNPKIKPLKSILFSSKLKIPHYQRPYKWQKKNVKQLMEDIIQHKDKSAYRIGTVVIHKDEEDNLNIVDGQQRILTLTLIATALFEHHKELKKQYNINELSISNWEIENDISKHNLVQNYNVIKTSIKDFGVEEIDFFFTQCEFVYIELETISEAFQFFDSQNSRGKDLEPHDLLKAFHLREMKNNSEQERIDSVEKWESVESKELVRFFNDYLFRVRNWSKGRSARYFTKNDVNIFKGISLDNPNNFNFIQPYRINHFFTEQYNSEINRKIDLNTIEFPFQIDQLIINGKRFFEYFHYYSKHITSIESDFGNNIIKNLGENNEVAKKILKTLQNYEGRNRTGDKYVKNIFDCCLLYYLDKFGTHDLGKAIEKFFLWSYKLRIELHSVQLASIDNAGLTNNGFFRTIREAIDTKDIRQKNISSPNVSRGTKIDEIINHFKELNNWTIND